MKTLLFTNLYPFKQAPTRGMYHVSVFRALSQHCETRLVAPLPWWTRMSRPQEWLVPPRETSTGIDASFPTYWTVPRLHTIHGNAMYASVRSFVRALRRDFPFDAILAAWAYPDGYAAARLAREFDCPLVINVLGSDINALTRKPELETQIKQALGCAHKVIAVSHALRARVLELGIAPDRVIVQHNGVDGERFRLQNRCEVRKRLGLFEDCQTVLYVGNWVTEKGVDVLVQAFARLKEAGNSRVQLALVGGGPLEPVLRALVKQHELENQVHFCGRKSHTEIPDWMAASDVLCLPSLREGCPNVILEALSSGRPVVASQVGGVPELLNTETGIMVEAGNAEALAKALRSALEWRWNDEGLRQSVRNRSWEEVGRNYFAALSSSVTISRSAKA